MIAADRFKSEGSLPAGKEEHVVQVMVPCKCSLVAVAVGNGEDAENKDKVQDQLEEDPLTLQLLASPLDGFF